MGKRTENLSDKQIQFINEQHLFFVGTAMQEGRVNISPKGMDTLRVVNENKVIWLNLTGSGNETASHLQVNNRMTILFCSFEEKPLILRLYGNAQVYHPRDEEFKNHISLFPTSIGARQIIELDIDLVQSSCGFAVPLMDFKSERSLLKTWSENKGQTKIEDYWADRNSISIDGNDTNIIK